MSKKGLAAGLVALVVVCGLAASIVTYDWGMDQGIEKVPFGLNDDGTYRKLWSNRRSYIG